MSIKNLLAPVCGAFLLLTHAGVFGAEENPVTGRWLSGNGNGVIELYSCEGKLCGKLAWIAHPPADGSEARDGKNPNKELRTRPLCGLTMLGGFRKVAATEWKDGWIYSPENGETYSANITMEGKDQLRLRGYVGVPLFGRTETWTRAPAGFPPCGQR